MTVKAYIEQIHGYLEEAGRDRKNFGIDPWISIQGLNKDEWHQRVEAWGALGASHVAVNTMGAGFTRRRRTLTRSGPSVRFSLSHGGA